MPGLLGWMALGLVVLFVVNVSWESAVEALARWRRRRRYALKPFVVEGELFTLAEYKALLKIYAMGNDNGTGHWAAADGEWWDKARKAYVYVEPHEVRQGIVPEPFFTHVMYYGK